MKIINKNSKAYSFWYMLLIAIAILAPEAHGVSLRYVFIPLLMMSFVALLSSRFKEKLNKIHILNTLFILLILISTLYSSVISFSPNVRSTLILAIFFLLLWNKVPREEDMIRIKKIYILITIICSLWIIFTSLKSDFDRYNFIFFWGEKDVNYLLALMLPGTYLAIRFLVFEKTGITWINLTCVISTLMSVLIIQTRAAFLTVLISSFILTFEYFFRNKIKRIYLILIPMLIILISILISYIWLSPEYARLTSIDSYTDNVRLEIWRASLVAFENNRLIGSGLGASNYFSSSLTGFYSHSNYIDIIGDFGVIGIFIFSLIIFSFLKVEKLEDKLHMFSFMTVCLFPLAFINGFETIAFWLPLLFIAHEFYYIKYKNFSK